jgi:sulfur carrier protein
MMRLKVNGVEEEFAVTTISELLAFRGIDPVARFVAVAVNGSVVRRSEWSAKPLGPGDDVEIVRPFSGG